ncbi:MAG: type I-D CRISPR-associated protein Cas10d/Csc3, partial [Dolichospermum sp.]
MKTILVRLIIETLSHQEKNTVLMSFMETVLPAMEDTFSLIPALGSSIAPFNKNADQSLLVHVINGLLTAWNLNKYLPEKLTETEQRLLCLGFTLHDYDKYYYSQKIQTPGAHETSKIRELCYQLAKDLNFAEFWTDWEDYLLDICFLAQNTQAKNASNLGSSNWEVDGKTFGLDYPDRVRLCELLRFGDIAVHIQDPSEILINFTRGKQLHKSLENLEIEKSLVYHRLRDCRGLLTNQIHNAVVKIASKLDWQPILYFAQGVVYLAPRKFNLPTLLEIQEFVWDNILNGDSNANLEGLKDFFSSGEVGFVRDGKGIKIAPLTRELFSPANLIIQLADVMIAKVKNIKDPATPKRLEKIHLSDSERAYLADGANVWADRFAEFIVISQREFFESPENREKYINWILAELNLQDKITSEQSQFQSGGVNYGWYQVAAHYIASLPNHIDLRPESEDITELLRNLSKNLAIWANENNLLPEHTNLTREIFFAYISEYLEIAGWENCNSDFQKELTAYSESKVSNKAICSLSSGEFIAEEQLDSVVLFKPQQYSNKNALGGGRIKRGISKIWSLEMLLRQAYWNAPAGKLEEQQPIFMYIFPAYLYSPQIACAVGLLVNKLQKTNLWDIRTHWQKSGMQLNELRNMEWIDKEPKLGRYGSDYSTIDMPFMAMRYTKTLGKTITDAWVEPAFLSLALPLFLGVKVVATASSNLIYTDDQEFTASSDPIYASDQEFVETVKLDGPAGFWNLLNTSPSLRLDEVENALTRLLIVYSLHLDNRSKKPDARWQALNGTVRDLVTDVLNIFAIADEGFRNTKKEPGTEDVKRIWNYAQTWVKGDTQMQEKLKLIERIVTEYRQFYQVNVGESSHSILLPISKALEVILTVPDHLETEDMILQGA